MEELKEGWRRVKLGEVAEYISNKINTSELNENNYISTENMIVNRGGVTKATNIPQNAKVNCFSENDILFSNIRTYFKKLWKADFNGGASNDVLIIRSLNSKNILNDYLYYIMSEEKFFDYTVNTSKGTKMPRGDKAAIMQYEFYIPEDIKVQQKIASILSALDDKIELNNEMNKTLEEMAQTLFKRWFIDFDFPNENGEPYRSSGGKMVDSELGEIPEGWRIGSLEEIVNISSGKRPKVKKEKDKLHKIPIIGANGVMSYTNEFMYNEKLLTIGRVGTLGVVQKYYDKIWPSDNSLVIKSDYLEMIYFILKNVDYKSLNRGSTQPLITQTDMKNLKIIIGETELILEFCKIIFKLFDFQRKNQQEINSLTEIRDTLLPKLMSGEIEV
ncbi:restriction endonuclease subunit S [Candidatus Cetobacterium colombiensis]|uniref:Restriction endonuclease subunit S n=1 Tax=Candidatus Cetobacterium colombiensis TaxID=3073100 RepID=A0ABU4W7E5_9FUSO|nr:restriction endonuclease subunit S [Candidatus Cetobacterium colombiensis]MDX8335105.1 restriction endonuclease subunit S [Candidatus Cetobacterium colombiensis]